MTKKVDALTLQRFVSEELLNGRPVEMGEDLLLSGLLDSLGVMALVEFIDMERGSPIPPEDVTLNNFSTIAKIADYLDHA